MTDLIPPEALAAAAPVVKEALENLAPTIRRGAGALARHILNSTIASLQIGFSPYLHLSYARCRSVKTLLSQDRPLALLNIYVHLQMQCGDSHLSDDDLIEDLRQYRNIVITGLAGSGKSMLTKYMTIRFFENSNGMIPLFVELRQINLTKSPQLLNYIYQSCASAGNKISYAQFELALRAGGLLLILDGFDEVEFKHRNEIENQILEISEKYPKSLIVLSSRPDERFAAWQLFYTFEVESLTKLQVLALISKIDYDTELKARFHREVDLHLYESHKSFLSSPLLSSIMLLTYEQFAEIPSKIHIFYEQAFSALFRRHDAQKAQFIRKTYANLALDDFRNFFSALCAFSYAEERFAFLDGEIRELTEKALNYAAVRAKIPDVLRDLHECLCMLQRDGIFTIFVHRSFQEYFCALFVANYHGPALREMLDRFAFRLHDEVIPMLFEMARDKVDREWTLPHIDRLLGDIDERDVGQLAELYSKVLADVAVVIVLSHDSKLEVTVASGTVGTEYRIFALIFRLYQLHESGLGAATHVFNAVKEGVERVLLRVQVTGMQPVHIETALAELGGSRADENGKWVFHFVMSPANINRLDVSGAARDCFALLKGLKADIEHRIGGQDTLVERLFGDRSEGAKDARRRNASTRRRRSQ